jgi:transcriptional regulator with XRE-family HTH domain
MNKKSHNKAFGIVLREIRVDRCKTQEALAFESGLDRTYISLLELGTRSPTLDTIMALCLALNVSLSSVSIRIDEVMRDGSPT